MGQRRFAPLILLVVLCTSLLVARLYRVQITEHTIWANEAANLVRSGRVLPYERGRILDAGGRVLARDEKAYRVDLVYRDFRRDHPLGQIAHARSTLELRPRPYREVRESAVTWALDLGRMRITELREFEDRGALRLPELEIAPAPEGVERLRMSRTSDLRFYLGNLLGVTTREWRAWREVFKAKGQDAERSFLAAMAEIRGRSLEVETRALEDRVTESIHELERLAWLLAQDRASRGEVSIPTPEAATDELLLDLDDARRKVEDDAASQLFFEAAGFKSSRVDPELLAQQVDLSWIAIRLRWDGARTIEWLEGARRDWLSWRDVLYAERLFVELMLPDVRWSLADRLMGGIAGLYDRGTTELQRIEPRPDGRPGWQGLEELTILGELAGVFDLRKVPEFTSPVFPARFPPILAQSTEEKDRWRVLARTYATGRIRASTDLAAYARIRKEADRMRAVFEPLPQSSARTRAAYALIRELFDDWEERFQAGLRERLSALRQVAADRDEVDDAGRLVFAAERLERATERARYILRDRGSRERKVARDPSYDVVHLLTRYEDRFAGFIVREIRQRVHGLDDPLERRSVELLVGEVRERNVQELRHQRAQRRNRDALISRGTRDSEEDRLLRDLVRTVYDAEQKRGGGGIEGLMDRELSGKNGYRERRGLGEDDAPFRERGWQVDPIDGRDVRLTLDLELQMAAQRVLEDPQWDPDPSFRDERWLANPVGAIVLVTVEGDVLAAASTPMVDRYEPGSRPTHDQEFRERTLTQPGFQPPGSVFKPFVAAHALDRLGWDPLQHIECTIPEGGSYAGYRSLRCNIRLGHGPIDLRTAIKRSCNVTFAHLGELFGEEHLKETARNFGFGQPTGIRWPSDRGGLLEHSCSMTLRRPYQHSRQLLQAANGLAVVEATPMQVARAMAGLATGVLPRMRIVDTIGDEVAPRGGTRLPYGESSLDFVREAMEAVTSEREGSAIRAKMTPAELGFQVAGKTGSADLQARSEVEDGARVRKHTWFAGWFPAREPRYAFVIFLNDVQVTSSHSSIWVASQFLGQDVVRSLVE